MPAAFRFTVKLPKEISHQRKLVACDDLLASFLAEIAGLGEKLATLLLQLPPKLDYEPTIAVPFLSLLTRSTAARIACEPRHPSWFGTEADRMMADLGIARVAADPAPVAAAAEPGGCPHLRYWRLHGSPVMYRSAYGSDRLEPYAARMRAEVGAARTVWCMFDNTASSAAAKDALILRGMI